MHDGTELSFLLHKKYIGEKVGMGLRHDAGRWNLCPIGKAAALWCHCSMTLFILWHNRTFHLVVLLVFLMNMRKWVRPDVLVIFIVRSHTQPILLSGFKSSCCIFWSAENRCFPGDHRVNISSSLSPVLAIWQVEEWIVGKVRSLRLHRTRDVQDIYPGFQNHMTTVC